MEEGILVEAAGLSWSAIALGVAVISLANVALWLLLRWRGRRQGRPDPVRRRVPLPADELAELRAEVDRLKVEIRSMQASGPEVSPYNQALGMAREGFPAADVAARCGITRGEAELLVGLFAKTRIKGLE